MKPELSRGAVREAIYNTCPQDSPLVQLSWNTKYAYGKDRWIEVIVIDRVDIYASEHITKRIHAALNDLGYVCSRSRTRVHVALVERAMDKPDFVCRG